MHYQSDRPASVPQEYSFSLIVLIISSLNSCVYRLFGISFGIVKYYIECGVEFTNMYGDINEAFYYSISSMFSDFVSSLNKLDSDAYYERNADRIKTMCLSTDCVGWGFNEEMMRIYYEIQWRVEED